MANIKWSAFPSVVSPGVGDTLVGLHSGANYQFTGLTIPFSPSVGGTGIANLVGSTITLGGSFAMSGAFGFTGTLTNTTSVTFPTSGTLLTSAGAVTSITGTADQVIASASTGAVTLSLPQNIATTSTPIFAGITAGNINITAGTISTVSTNANMALTPNGSGRVVVGAGSPFTSIFGLYVQGTGTTGTSLNAASWTTSATGPAFLTLARGRGAGPGDFQQVESGDILGQVNYSGADGVSFVLGAKIRATVTGTVGTGIIPSSISMFTSNASGTSVLGFTLSQNQVVTLANALPVGSGGLGITSTPTNGQVPIGNGTNYVAATITAGSGIAITNGAGTITISSNAGELPWTNEAVSFNAAMGNGYIITAVATATLPATASLGDTISFIVDTSALLTVQASAGKFIRLGSAISAAAGTATNSVQGDSITFIYSDTTLTWIANSSVGMNWNIV